jgi:putative DNA methylase
MVNVHTKTKNLSAPPLKDAPALIEHQLPVGRLSAEAHKERKAGAGQTLTAIGSYWKGRKPLILVRAAILADLVPHQLADSAKALRLAVFASSFPAIC